MMETYLMVSHGALHSVDCTACGRTLRHRDAAEDITSQVQFVILS